MTKKSYVKFLGLLLVVGLLFAAAPVGQAQAATEVVYDGMPATLPYNLPSVGFQATSTYEFGDYVHLAGTNRVLREVSVTMSAWALRADYPNVGDSTGWDHPITLNLYNVIPGTPNGVGAKIGSVTQTFDIPWRPVADPTCATPTAWRAPDGICYNGFAFNITFDLTDQHIVLPNDVLVSVAYNTQTHGYAPIGVAGPYDSLNVGALGAASVGTDHNTDNVFLYSTWSGAYGGADKTTGIFREDTAWTPNGTLNFRITADPFPEYNGNVSGVLTTSDTGAVSGTLSGAYALTVSGQVTGYVNNRATFSGTVTGDIVGNVTATINDNGVDTLAGTITGTGANLPVRILGIFPKSGTNGEFEGQIITGEVPPLATSMAITTPGNVSTVFVGQTLQLGVTIDPPTAAYGAWSIWEPEGTNTGSTISDTGLLTAGTPGTITVIAKALDGSLLDATKSITITYPPTKLLMDPATFTTTDTCTGTHEVYVKVQAVTNLVAYDLDLTYDSSLITVTKVENVGIVDGAPAPGNSFADGVINFGWYYDNGAGDPPTYNVDLNLIKITFQSKGFAGTGGFTIQPTSILVDWPDVFAIPYQITGGATVNFGSIVTNTTAEPDKAYCDLALAVAEANANDILRADANITTIDSITVDKVLTLNTNSKTITRTGTGMVGNNFFVVNPGGNLTINGGGTITTTLNTAIRIIGNGITPAKVKLENATVYGPYFSVAVTGNEKYVGHDTPYPAIFEMTGGATNETVFVSGNGAELIVSGGTLTGAAPIMGNGTVSETTDVNKGGTKITIGGETTVVNGNTNLAIYHPQDGLLTINGGTITGTNGIEMKAGDLIVTGGTILGTGPFADPTATGSGSTDTGDAILIYNRNGYTGDLNVTISGSPTITSTNAYALREFTLPGETSRLGVAAISGGHFTGGKGAVSFTTVSDVKLDLTGGDYNTDPIAYVYAPYGTYLNTDNLWYIAPLPVISSTDFDDQVNLGVQSTFNLTVDPSVPGAFNMVFTGYPSETEIVYLGVTYTCVMSGDPAICTITVPVMLTGLSQSLPFAITVATATSETPAASYPVTATLHALAPAYGVTGRDLASLSVTVPVASGFAVTGTFSMQGNLSRAGIPVTLTWGGTLVPYGPSADTTSAISNNFSLSVLYGGDYTITTLQPRYLNVTSDLLKKITVAGPYNMSALILKGGNAYWKATADTYDNIINGSDASLVGNQYGSAGSLTPIGNHGDCNFDGIVNIQDLALVGGNYDLTSELAYNTSPNIWVP